MSAHQFKAGDQVVCVDPGDFSMLRHGCVYTIRSVDYCPNFQLAVVEVVEVENPYDGRAYGGPAGFRASRFRPVQKRTTSIEIFRALLNPTEQDKEEIELADFILEHSEVPFQ